MIAVQPGGILYIIGIGSVYLLYYRTNLFKCRQQGGVATCIETPGVVIHVEIDHESYILDFAGLIQFANHVF